MLRCHVGIYTLLYKWMFCYVLFNARHIIWSWRGILVRLWENSPGSRKAVTYAISATVFLKSALIMDRNMMRSIHEYLLHCVGSGWAASVVCSWRWNLSTNQITQRWNAVVLMLDCFVFFVLQRFKKKLFFSGDRCQQSYQRVQWTEIVFSLRRRPLTCASLTVLTSWTTAGTWCFHPCVCNTEDFS